MAAPNVANTTTLTFKNSKGALTTAAATIINNAASSGLVIKIISLYIANVDGAAAADVTLNIYSQDDIGGTATAIASTVSVANDATAVIVDKHSPIYLEEDMSLGGLASANGDLVYVASYQEIS